MATTIPVSLILTTLNEERSILSFLHSIEAGTALPAEIVVCDGGSRDRTLELVRGHTIDGVPIIAIAAPGATIAHGRNEAIRHSRYDALAISDAGCILDADWLERITQPLLNKPDVDVVSGGYRFAALTRFQQCAAAAEIPVHRRPTETFLPSSRSFAIRKQAFWEAGGYPEHLAFAGDDTALCVTLNKMKTRFELRLDAVVTWYPRTSLKAFIKQHYLYGVGDGESGLNSHRYRVIAAKHALFAGLLAGSIVLPPVSIALFAILLSYFIRLYPKYEWNTVPFCRSLCAYFLIANKDASMHPGFLKGSLRRNKGLRNA